MPIRLAFTVRVRYSFLTLGKPRICRGLANFLIMNCFRFVDHRVGVATAIITAAKIVVDERFRGAFNYEAEVKALCRRVLAFYLSKVLQSKYSARPFF